MNRIYKVIYSKARQCSIVVSELAKSSRKGAGHAGTPALARIIIATLAAGILTWGIAPGVSWAAPGNDQSAVVFDDKGSLMSTDATIYHNHLRRRRPQFAIFVLEWRCPNHDKHGRRLPN